MESAVDMICGTVLAIVLALVIFTDFFNHVGKALEEWAKSRKRIT